MERQSRHKVVYSVIFRREQGSQLQDERLMFSRCYLSLSPSDDLSAIDEIQTSTSCEARRL